jgi:fructose-1-phosphate kinase PfkB-like protein
MARRAGARVAIDAAGASLRHALKARPDLVRINRQELSETLGLPAATLARGRAATLAASARLLAMGCAMVAISNGAREAFLVAAEGAWTGRPPRIEPRGALGAGDAMLAGLIAALLREDAPADVLRLGLACGSAAASEPETRPPRRRAIRALFGQVATRPVACFKGAVSFSDAF